MTNKISENFGELGITISRHQILQVATMVTHFPLRRTHPLTFNGPYIGCDPVAFTTADYNALFDIFRIRRQDVELKVRATPTINRNFIVSSDPFNLLTMWLVHLAPIYIKDKTLCYNFQLDLLKYFSYRIFCSTANHSWRHGANHGVMEFMIGTLTLKSDVIRLGSWSKVIDVHCERLLDSTNSFYYTVLMDGAPDDFFLRVITDAQTALRSKIVTFAQAYYETHAAGDEVRTQSPISENADGERILAQTASVIDSATQAIVNEILNPNAFVRDMWVEDVAKLYDNVSARMLKQTLLRFCETAVLQTSSRTFDDIRRDKDGVVFVGLRALTLETIRSMVRLCRERGINMGNRGLMFQTMRDVMRSSRTQDTDILTIKRSVGFLVDSFQATSNDASRASLKLAVISYILYRTIDKMK